MNVYIAMENGPVEIVDFPIKNGGSFHGKMLVHQRISWHIIAAIPRRFSTHQNWEKKMGSSRWDDGEILTPFFRWLLTEMVCMALLHG